MQLLANGKQQFIDGNGAPLANGLVYMYAPGTTTPQTTYQDSAGTIQNPNPITLDANGQAVIWGSGTYRQVVTKPDNTLVWDQTVATPDLNAPLTQLSAASGANLVGHDDTTVGVFLQNRLQRVVQSLASLRALDKTKTTQAILNGSASQGDGGYGVYYLDPSDTTSADNGWGVIVASDGGRWKLQRGSAQTTTTAADDSFRYVSRATSHTGGTAGYVNSAMKVATTVGAGVTNFEWGFLSTIDNSATAGENVAVYGQAKKRAQGPTWAGCFEIQDISTADPAAGGAMGIELACSANGGDTSFQRNGLHVAMGKLLPAGTTCEWGNGVRTTAGTDSRFGVAFNNEGSFRVAAFKSSGDASGFPGSATFLDTGKANYGVDLSGGTYSSAAIRLGATQKLAFDVNATVTMSENSGVLSVAGSYLQMNQGFGISGSGNIASTATAGSNGAAPSQVAGYMIFKIDGSNFKIPYYAP